MCTVSIVPSRDGSRLVCNRDERLARPAALVPVPRKIQRRTVLFPLDPLSGGTWIGINDAGLVLALLNRTPDGVRVERPRQSRGVIIPSLLAHDAIHAVVQHANGIAAARFEPFQLIAIQGSELAVIASDGRALRIEVGAADRPLMFTSSSLGDSRVEGPRRSLFERLVIHAPMTARVRAQDRFHRHHWRRRPAISVRMARRDARTVSRTIVELSSRGVSLRYRPLAPVN